LLRAVLRGHCHWRRCDTVLMSAAAVADDLLHNTLHPLGQPEDIGALLAMLRWIDADLAAFLCVQAGQQARTAPASP
jgi:hypothetical protein